MKRREFITLLGGAAGWPLVARAQQPERMRHIGVLMLYVEDDAAGQLRARTFRQQLEKLGWTGGRNIQIDYHWGIGDAVWVRSAATQILQRSPDVVLANGGQAIRPMQEAAQTTPIIFIGSTDPVAEGFVQSLARPGGSTTGFSVLQPSQGPKLLGLLKEVAPRVRRIMVFINPANSGNRLLADLVTSAASAFGVEVIVAPVREPAEFEAAVAKLDGKPDCGLIVPPDPVTNVHRKLVVELAARHRVPAIHALRIATVEGGLMSYGVDIPELFRQAAMYADRILRGEKAGDLPVQQPTKFELVINLRTARTLSLEVPTTLLATADEVIE
jgi:putative tryptophan/tyrosine transport system substrate-binding protein